VQPLVEVLVVVVLDVVVVDVEVEVEEVAAHAAAVPVFAPKLELIVIAGILMLATVQVLPESLVVSELAVTPVPTPSVEPNKESAWDSTMVVFVYV